MKGLENYIPVKQRIHDMREEHPDWGVRTEMTFDGDYWRAVTTISDESGRLIATGHAVERNTKPFDAEKAETSAVGRALVFAGWTDSLELSQEEMERSAVVHAPPKPAGKKQPAAKPQAKKPTIAQQTVAAKNELVALMGKDAAAEYWKLHQSMTPNEIVAQAKSESEAPFDQLPIEEKP